MVVDFEPKLGLVMLICLLVFELLIIANNTLWALRRYFSFILSGVMGAAISLITIQQSLWVILLLTYLGIVQLILILRLAGSNIDQKKSRKLSKKSFVYINLLTFAVYLISPLPNIVKLAVYCCVGIIFVTLVIVLIKTLKSKVRPILPSLNSDELPTVTLAIPSRNENYDLVQALEQAINSNYPKLEIVVLDDCSGIAVNEIIKHFAQEGVIFLKGTQPRAYWLAKNWAYEQLLHNANGEYIIYAGVDVRMDTGSIGQIVAQMQSNNYNMLSVLPVRVWQKYDWYLLLQSLRYHRIFSGLSHVKQPPPPLSSCFVVKKDPLVKTGGFNTCRNSIYPEKVIAKNLKNYNFLISDKTIKLTSVKSLEEQFNTAVRTYYPLTRLCPEKIALRAIILAFMLMISAKAVYIYVTTGQIEVMVAILIVLGLLVHIYVGYAVKIHNIIVWTCQLPLLVLSEIFIMHYSMFKYEFSDVIWKGRNVCIPLLRYEKSLPKTDLKTQ
ncbi:hypothetical protein A3F37_02275 [Candidatus Saccharibacteria bacterium RIFCSPHIGHO2_12_FULL_41_12]|nr:MAG: hypothetical protein A3F37_02275 [Candidatus Saccharibacteria bacterium RIFCSPHIGHO2_12_FULL_41_12]